MKAKPAKKPLPFVSQWPDETVICKPIKLNWTYYSAPNTNLLATSPKPLKNW